MKKTQKHTIVESLQAAAAILRVELELVKKCKRLGCPAFKPGNRIDVDELKKWIAENEPLLKSSGDNVSRKDLKLDEEIRKLRIRNDRDEKLVVLKDKVKACNAACVDRVRTILEQKLENEYPSAVSQMDVPQARVYGRRLGDQILLEFQKLSAEWDKI